MAKSAPRIAMGLVLAAGFCAAVKAQAVTEYGSMASKSATVSKRANSISNEIGGVWGSLDKTIKSQDRGGSGSSQGTSQSRTTQRTPVRSRRRNTRTAAGIHEDPSRIQIGLGYEEVIRRFGPASFEVSTGPGTKTLAYPSKNGGIDVDLLDGRVARVAAAKTQEIAVVGPR